MRITGRHGRALLSAQRESQHGAPVVHARPPRYDVLDRRSFIKKIDLYFTDMAGTRLDGDYVVEAPASPNAADIQALYSGVFVRLCCDAQQAGAFERGDGETTRVGEDVATWTSRFRETEWCGDLIRARELYPTARGVYPGERCRDPQRLHATDVCGLYHS